MFYSPCLTRQDFPIVNNGVHFQRSLGGKKVISSNFNLVERSGVGSRVNVVLSTFSRDFHSHSRLGFGL